jgi:dTDP-4-dehydrorhamnose reductase
MKVLILGGSGMLGHQLYRTLAPAVETYVTFRSRSRVIDDLFGDERSCFQVDALNFDSVRNALHVIKPTWVVNCIGIIKQLAKDPEAMLSVNSRFPHRLARLCNEVGAKLIHISTDCVFDGEAGNYTEGDTPDATDLYGRTKALGEPYQLGAITLRTSIVGTSLFSDVSLLDWFIAHGNDTVRGYTQAIFTGLTTEALSWAILRSIENNITGGLWHVASDKISKYELLCRVRDALGLKAQILPDYDFKCDRSLNGTKFRSYSCVLPPPTWNKMIESYARDRRDYYRWKPIG